MSDNWVVQNLQNSLDTWNEKLSEVWKLLTESPQQFKGGGIGSKYHQGLDIVFPWERRSLPVSRVCHNSRLERRTWKMCHYQAWRKTGNGIWAYERNKGDKRSESSEGAGHRRSRDHGKLDWSAPAPWCQSKRQLCESGERVFEYTQINYV